MSNTQPEPDWLRYCREQEIDPDEVRIVFSRYEAYRRFTTEGEGTPIGLEQWFRFYHLEKTSEGEQAGLAPGGFGADSSGGNIAAIQRPRDFLEILKALQAAEGAGTR